ncbi:MAG TPA: hypothetical protein VIC84_12440 [Blastocatellia bacterium]
MKSIDRAAVNKYGAVTRVAIIVQADRDWQSAFVIDARRATKWSVE